MTQDKYTLKIKITNSHHFLTAQTFLFCFHCGAISTLAPNTRVAIFPDKHVSLHSITFITTIWVESFMIRYTPFLLRLETNNFIFQIHFYTNSEKSNTLSSRKQWIKKPWRFPRRVWRKFFSDKTNFQCNDFGFIGLLSLQFPYDFHCLILWKQTSNIIAIKILTAIM